MTVTVPWAVRRSHQSLQKEINPESSLKGLMLKLKLQYFGHLRQKSKSLEKTLMLGKVENRRREGRPRMRWLNDIIDTMDMNLNKLQEDSEGQRTLACCSPQGHKESDMTLPTKVHLVNAMVFPIVMYGCKYWTIK